MKLEAKDLRIGNYLLFGEEIQIVSSLHADNTLRLKSNVDENCHGCYKVFDCNIKSIPLTKEWLIKFGFEEEEKNIFYKRSFIHNDIKINLDDFECVIDNVLWLDISIKFVHQIQNLYFTLIGEELTIK